MRNHIRSICCIALVVFLVMFTVSCSSILDLFKGEEEPEARTPPVKKPVPKPTPTPKPTPKPEKPKPDVQSIIQEGIAHRQAEEYQEAIASFKKALEIEPDNAEALQQVQETQKELDELITAHLNKGIKFFSDDALEDAMREWDNVLELDPSNEKALEYKERTQRELDALKENK